MRKKTKTLMLLVTFVMAGCAQKPDAIHTPVNLKCGGIVKEVWLDDKLNLSNKDVCGSEDYQLVEIVVDQVLYNQTLYRKYACIVTPDGLKRLMTGNHESTD